MPWWSWMLFGAALLAVEMMLPGSFFVLFFGIGALIVGSLSGAGVVAEPWDEWLLFSIFSVGSLVAFRSRLLDTGFSPGVESLEVRLFREEEIPWRSLGFASVTFALQHYFEDRRSGQFRMHRGTVHPACPV